MKIFVFLTPDIFEVFGERIDGRSVIGKLRKIWNTVDVCVGSYDVCVVHDAQLITR